MIITITVEDEHEGKRLVLQKRTTDLEIDYAGFDLVGNIVADLRLKIEAARNPPFHA